MPISDDIAAIRADPTKSERDVNKLKCQSMYDALLPFLKQTYRFNQIDWTPWDLWLEDDGAVLCVTFKAVRPASGNRPEEVLIRPQQVWRFPNPPPLAADRSDNRIQAAKELLMGLLP